MKISRLEVRQLAAEKCWLSEEAPWSKIWETARLLGQEFLESLRSWVSDLLDGTIPAFD